MTLRVTTIDENVREQEPNALLHPAGNGIGMLDEGEAGKACCTAPLSPVPTDCPALLMPTK